MPTRADTILKLSLAAAALIAGTSVGYYYGVFLPGEVHRREAREQAAREEAAKAQSKARAEIVRRQQSARLEYEDCVNFADLAYRNRWTLACKAQNQADIAAFQDCADDLFSSEDGCRARFPIRPERDCTLPGQTAESYAAARDTRKAECLGRLQATQGAAPVSQSPPGL